MASSLTDVFQALDQVFQKVSLRWYVFGAQAVAFYGAARFSADVDVTLLPENYPINDLVSALQAEDLKIPVANSADLIAMKIFSGRDKDLQDAQAVLQAQRENVDIEAVRKTLKLLETALDRSDLVLVLDKVLSKLKS